MYITEIWGNFTDTTIQPSQTQASIAVNIATFLAALCWIFLIVFIISKFSKPAKDFLTSVISGKTKLLLWLVPTVAMLFSLYFSEFLGWQPCNLCWIQRGFIYSLSFLMLVYYFKSYKTIRYVAYVFATFSSIVSTYHVLLEKYPNLESATCDPNNPCSSPWFTSIGFLTTAGMALTATITIIALLSLSTNE
ncbi:MAG: disulfide bond formation protein B [Acidimicrobiia bacterium]